MRHLLTLDTWTSHEIEDLFSQARLYKRTRATGNTGPGPLIGKTVALLFEKPSLRTRVSFEVGARELGASTLYLSPSEVGLGQRESVADVARVLSGYVHAVVIRTFSHTTLVEFAAHASIPVINGLTDGHHPCQGLTDLFTIQEMCGSTAGKVLAYVGDGNNCAHSLVQVAAKLGMHIRIASPAGYEVNPEVVVAARAEAAHSGGSVTLTTHPAEAVAEAQVIYTDVWTSMGQEAEAHQRRATFAPYQVNGRLVSHAAPDAIVLHPLPAHRGEEITDEVLDGPHARVFVQAENRLHVQKAVLRALLTDEAATSLTSLSA